MMCIVMRSLFWALFHVSTLVNRIHVFRFITGQRMTPVNCTSIYYALPMYHLLGYLYVGMYPISDVSVYVGIFTIGRCPVSLLSLSYICFDILLFSNICIAVPVDLEI